MEAGAGPSSTILRVSPATARTGWREARTLSPGGYRHQPELLPLGHLGAAKASVVRKADGVALKAELRAQLDLNLQVGRRLVAEQNLDLQGAGHQRTQVQRDPALLASGQLEGEGVPTYHPANLRTHVNVDGSGRQAAEAKGPVGSKDLSGLVISDMGSPDPELETGDGPARGEQRDAGQLGGDHGDRSPRSRTSPASIRRASHVAGASSELWISRS